MPLVRCPTPAEASSALSSLRIGRGSALFLFFGSEDPVLRASIRRLRPELTLYECPVGVRSEWKNHPEHPYRLHPSTRVGRIPTLLLLEHGIERGRLVEGDCAKPELVQAFLNQ